jgi:O-antigen ligase
MQTEKTLDATARLRIESFRTGVQLFQKNPLIGVGMNTLPALAKREWSFMTKSHASSGIDASFLSVLAQTGIIGTLLYSFFLGSMFFKAFQNRKNNFSSAVFSGGVGILFHALFVNTLFFNLFLPIFFIAFGIIRGEKQEN